MIITKQLEEEIVQFLDNYWKLYLEGDLQTWSTYMTDDYKNIGTTQQEIWNSKQEIMNYTESVIDQMAGYAELRNKNTQVFPLDPFILAHEFGDIYIKMESDWVFYSKLRLSSIIQKSGEGWQVVHQHGSYPDSKTQQGEAFAFEKISKENLELREAVKRRTIELENKSRELEIETALEKVRSTALAMRQPADMVDICQVISMQLESLSVNNIRNVQTAIFYPAKGTYFNYEFYARHDKRLVTEVDYRSHELQELFANQMQQGAGELSTYVLKGKELKDWYEYQKTTNQFVDVYLETAHSLTYYWYSLGPVALGISTYSPMNEAEIKLFKHFRNVFDLAYRRYIDIELAVFQAREARIETALERVRSRTMGMQKSEELKEVIQIVYEQFVHLNILVEHAGFIMDYKTRDDMHIWLADKHEVPFQVTIPYFDSPHWNSFLEAKEKGTDFFANRLTFEEKNKFYHDLFKLFPVPDKAKEYYLNCPGLAISTVLLENVGLYIENFSGIPYTDEENATLIRFGNVFQQTYTRFLDLQKAEAQALRAEEDLIAIKVARQKAEEALAELKATQTQLIHAEKMASLGELTAGIAHEIQNPLNFVNNFAEVSLELIDEMKQDSSVGGQRSAVSGQQSANEILDDIKQNLQKINHHGKRADAIVKGMLQHSRTSTGMKELTDINALADEYLRLAYHGLRAKDKDFNATLKTDFDTSLGKINIMPQDIGRVILNLINNAFYAVNEKNNSTDSRPSEHKYEPTVTVRTALNINKVEISVKDNGNGIPPKLRDKIFQPFFTTKPTGQGTGLGLSMSYDIITKGHGGDFEVISLAGEGSEFIIRLPFTT